MSSKEIPETSLRVPQKSYDDYGDDYVTPRHRHVPKMNPTGGDSTPSSSRKNTPRERPHAQDSSEGKLVVNHHALLGRLPHSRTLSAASSNSNSSHTLGQFSAAGDAVSNSNSPHPNAAVHAKNSNQDSPSSVGRTVKDTALVPKSNRASHTGQLLDQTTVVDSMNNTIEPPQNVRFVTPIFPGIAVTSTGSSSTWAIMLEQACQTLEMILGPLLEAVLCESVTMGVPPQSGPSVSTAMLAAASTFAAAAAAAAADVQGSPHSILPKPPMQRPPLKTIGASPPPAPFLCTSGPNNNTSVSLEAELQRLKIPLPPYGTAACIDVLLGHDWICSTKFPVAIRKRLETLQCGLQALASSPESLDGNAVLVAEQAIKGIITDCIRAMGRPSLLGNGSRQFQSFVKMALPDFESQQLYMETLLNDCQETIKGQEERTGCQA
ncbi:hypothetical protein CEUSTIGMA_g12163.t1 [Chlamydomonas eustigma]|uniref:Uncharacterized protein n=1 Tax=Chlamydomonas eustigma TaxID=1157962 RepID=A0A250XNS6_9CHLO|nr:hypothetical protein CEUSTIGMA_g12163.t1 [Chlamydomonas eustigma]|eukprot:GAX84741.1 hypothetical protein CEUSTIGMA_g12163.t1 [Chlamydomonas eustigma]